jgi:alcohol dehydrogenase class IV
MEGMLTVKANFLSDLLARETCIMIDQCYDALLNFPSDPSKFPLAVREKLLLASSIAGMVIAQTGTAVPHSMGYHFTLDWGTDHGRANGLLMAPFLQVLAAKEKADPRITPRIPILLDALGTDLDGFCARLEKLLGKREKASPEELQKWGSSVMKNAANTYIKPEQGDILEMFRQAVG